MIFVEFFKHQSYFLQIFFGKQPPCVVVSSTSVTRHTRVHTGNNETLPLVSQQSTCSAHNNKKPEIPQVYYSLHKKLWNFFHTICFNPKMDSIGIFSVLYHKYKGCPKKNRTRIRSYCINSVSFCGKSIRSAKSRHDVNSKLVKQVYMVQQLPPGSLIRHKTFFCENWFL